MRYFVLMQLNHESVAVPQPRPVPASLDQDIAAMSAFLDGQKADDLFAYKFHHPNAVCDAVLIVTANSRRHAQGLADGLLQICTERHREFLGMEGYDSADWILVDCNDIIVHIFQRDTRQVYRLEDLCVEPDIPDTLPRENRP